MASKAGTMMVVDEKSQKTYVPAAPPRGLVGDLNINFEELIPGGERQWDQGLLESCGDTCLASVCCNCFFFGRNRYRLAHPEDPNLDDFNYVNANCLAACIAQGLWHHVGGFLFPFLNRLNTRERLGIHGNGVTDCLAVWCCHCFTTAQENNQLQLETDRQILLRQQDALYTRSPQMVYDAPQAPNPIYVPGQTPAITAAQKKDDKAKVEVVEVDDANAEQTVAALRTVKKAASKAKKVNDTVKESTTTKTNADGTQVTKEVVEVDDKKGKSAAKDTKVVEEATDGSKVVTETVETGKKSGGKIKDSVKDTKVSKQDAAGGVVTTTEVVEAK